MTIVLPEDREEELLARAREIAERAYAPYSRYAVGAAVLTASGEIVGGCNVENASYGLSMCAERAAVFAARARGLADPREMPLVAIAVATRGGPAPWPCGACRQVLAEFAREDSAVLVADESNVRILKLKDLLPHAFHFEPRT
jgi:cytidine deaminase